MFVQINIKRKDGEYIGNILYGGEKIGDNNIGFANLIERKLTSNGIIIKNGVYINYYSSKQTAPTSTHDMVYIDSIVGEGRESLLDDIYRFSIGTNNLDITVPLVIRVGSDKFVYNSNNVIEFINIEREVIKKLTLEKK